MRHELFIDIETFSTVDLRTATPYRYAEDPRFEILMAAYALDDAPVRVVIGRDVLSIPGLWDPAVVKVAHNAQFERVCFSQVGRSILEVEPGEYLPPEDWHDTMAVAGERGYPQGLDGLARALGGEQKDSAGTSLINWFCKPDRAGNRRMPEDHPEKWAAFVEYCRQDVETLRSVHRRLGGFPTKTERRVYLADQLINDRGFALDREMASRAVEASAENRIEQEREVIRITGVDNPGSLPQMLEWFRGQGKLALPNMRAETIEKALARKNLLPEARRVLELRQELALVASKKYVAALNSMSGDDRLRGGFRFFGAHTGRWSGRGFQPHNMPREQFTKTDPVTGKDVWDGTAESAAILDLKLGLGVGADELKKLVRALFVGPFTVVDYAAIEARVIAWLAGEEWALDAFALGRDIYVETAERMSTPGNQLTRFQGKVAVLALGYNGGVGSLRAMGGEGSDEALQLLVNQWRNANPSIVGFWKRMETAFKLGGPVGDHIVVEKEGDSRLIVLPSGRAITYHDCRWEWTEDKWGRRVQRASFSDPKPPFRRADTYGGRLSENVTQAVARDVLAEALVRLEDAGHRPVAHVHDEILVEGRHSVKEITEIMTEQPKWARGLPLAGAGFNTERYRKD